MEAKDKEKQRMDDLTHKLLAVNGRLKEIEKTEQDMVQELKKSVNKHSSLIGQSYLMTKNKALTSA